MKQNIHPKYYPKSKIACACGAVFEAGSTNEVIQTEICSNCHPFYTGKSKLVDSAGRIDKFKARQVKTKALKEKSKILKHKNIKALKQKSKKRLKHKNIKTLKQSVREAT